MSDLARKFHDTYEKLAPSFGYETREDTKEFDPTTPNGKLMIAVCGEIAGELQAENAELKADNNELREEGSLTHAEIIREWWAEPTCRALPRWMAKKWTKSPRKLRAIESINVPRYKPKWMRL